MTAPPTTKRGIHPPLIIGAGVLLIAGLFYWLVSTGPVIEGQQGRIVGSGPAVLATTDPALFSQLGTAPVAQLAQWEGDGRVALLPVGTQVLVLAVDASRSRVRVVETGKEYYVQTSAVGR